MGGWSGALAVGSVFLLALMGMCFEPGRIDHQCTNIALQHQVSRLSKARPPIAAGLYLLDSARCRWRQ
jgi:hypothetical protein